MHVAAILKVKGRNVVTTTADESLLDVAKLLEQHDIGCIVIEGDDGQVAGIVSERDLVRAIGKSGAKVLKEPVSVYMTKTVVTAREADSIDRLMSEMTVHRFRHMPVVEGGRLIGLVSIGDLVKIHVEDAKNPLVAGLPSDPIVMFERGPAFDTKADFKGTVLARYSRDRNPLMSGYLTGHERIQGKAAAIDVTYGKGRVLLLGFRPQWRGQSHGSYKFFFNALYLP